MIEDDNNWVDSDPEITTSPILTNEKPANSPPITPNQTLILVETAFLASAASLIWLINYYFPLGPLLRLLFPLPIALIYLRWGNRASWMTALVSGLLITILMGPARSIVFVIPYGIMGVQLGALWHRNANWNLSLFMGTILGTFGFFFRIWLFSLLLGEDLWQYVINQMTVFADLLFIKLGILAEPSFGLISLLAFILVVINSLFYIFAVHLVALLILDRLGNPIPRPPEWLKIILDYE